MFKHMGNSFLSGALITPNLFAYMCVERRFSVLSVSDNFI